MAPVGWLLPGTANQTALTPGSRRPTWALVRLVNQTMPSGATTSSFGGPPPFGTG